MDKTSLESKIDAVVLRNPAHARLYLTDLLVQYLERLHSQKESKEINPQIFEAIELYIKQFRKHSNEDRKEVMRAIIRLIDEIQANDKGELKKFISCKKGCAFCCHINVDIYDDEAELILDYCKKNKISIDIEYLKRQSELKDRRAHARSDISACVFLKNNECSIYPVRPIACRKFAVVTPASLCEAAFHTSQVGIYFDLHIEVLASALANVARPSTMQNTLLKFLEK